MTVRKVSEQVKEKSWINGGAECSKPENCLLWCYLLIGPSPADTPKDLQSQAGRQNRGHRRFDHVGRRLLRDIDAVLAQQYPDLKIPKVVNKGISGQKAEDLIKRFDKDVVRQKPAFVTISIGINDVWHRLKSPHDEKVLATYRKTSGGWWGYGARGRHQGDPADADGNPGGC